MRQAPVLELAPDEETKGFCVHSDNLSGRTAMVSIRT